MAIYILSQDKNKYYIFSIYKLSRCFIQIYELFMVKYKILGSFTDLLKDIILRDTVLNKNYTLNHPRTKYTLDDILIDILYVLKTAIPWRSMRSYIHWNTLYHHFKEIVNRNIFGKLFSVLKRRYLSKRLINTFLSVVDELNKIRKTIGKIE